MMLFGVGVELPAACLQHSSSQIRGQPVDRCHVIMKNRLDTAVLPLDRESVPRDFDYPSTIGGIVEPAHSLTDLQLSGFFAGHLNN
jgi:hypothetical protein